MHSLAFVVGLLSVPMIALAQGGTISQKKCHSGSFCPSWVCTPKDDDMTAPCNCCYRTGGSYECVDGTCAQD